MPYDDIKDKNANRDWMSNPAGTVTKLTSAMLSDTADLNTYAKALRVYNGSALAITILATPMKASDDTSAGAVPITVEAGARSYEPIAVRRIWSTGSTNLSTGLTAGTVEVLLLNR